MQTEASNTKLIDTNKLKAAFAALRRGGYIARQSFMCCRTCAGSAIAKQAEASPRRSEIRGCVYYTKQGLEDLGKPGGKLAITYGRIGTQSGYVGDSTVATGRVVAVALRAAGLTVEWNGDPEETILVCA